jgi:hypothetical protein
MRRRGTLLSPGNPFYYIGQELQQEGTVTGPLSIIV